MNLGFEVVAARSKKTDANDDLAFEPMRQRARKEPRKQPSTDEKKVKRRLNKSAVAWSRRDSLDHDTEFVRYVLLSDTEALEASVIRDETTDEPTWAWLVSVIDRQDGGILEFVMSGSASGLDEAKGKADVALDRAEMDMMFERVGSRKQANGYYNDRPIMVPSLADLPADREDMAWYEVSSQRRSSGEAVMEVEFSGGSALQAKRAADELLTDPDVMFVLFTRSAGRGTYGVQMNASRKQAAMSYEDYEKQIDAEMSVPLGSKFPYFIVTTNMMETYNGIAWVADLRRNVKGISYVIGTVENDGHGGADMVRIEPKYREEWSDFVRSAFGGNEERATMYLLYQEESKTASRKQAAKNYYVFDEWPDDSGLEERPLAGPFASAEEASAALKDVAYPFQFPYGPETVVGDLFIAEGLPAMETQDFINQTLSSRRVAWTSQYADVADDEALVMFEEVGHRFHPEQGFGGENWQEDRERVIQSITETLLTSPYRERLAEFTQRHADYLEDINFHTLNEAVERAKNTLGQKMSNRRKHAGYRYEPDTQSSFDVKQYDQSPGEPFAHPSGHTYSGPEKAEATGESYVGSRSSSMQREADILEAMRFASLTEQRQLMAELNTIRANRTAARQADRDIDLTAAVIEDRLTPVLTKSMHTVATDWLTEVPTPAGDGDGTAREMVAQASVWFKRLSSEVVADRDEFAEQARGKARQLTSSLGVGREAAIASFLDAAAHLRSKQANELMGYGEGEYVTNAGDDMMMDDMSGMDMDPRYETNASRKHAEWDQSAFDAWMKQVDSKMVGMSGLGASDLPDQPYADWFEDGMSASEAAQLSLSDTADEMGFGGLFGSRKQAMPSDDLIDVDIEDYMGGDEGPDPDSQSGHAETALPYAGDDTTPAFRETGWTGKRRTSAMSDEEWDRAVEVDTEDMIYFLQEFKQLGSQVAGMNAQQMHDWYYRNWDDLTDEYGLAIDPDMIDWEEVAARVSKNASRKRRANRKTASGFYDHAGGVVSFGDWSHDEQVGDSYGRVFAKRNTDGTYDVVEVIYYASVNALGGNDYEEELANDEVFVVEVTNEYRGLSSPDDVSMSSGPDFNEYRNDLLMTNVSAAEAERLAEQYASDLSARGDHIASRKTASAGIIQHYVVYGDGYISDPYSHVNGGPEPVMYQDIIANLGGDAQRAADQYGRSWWIETRVTVDGDEISEESPWDAPDTEAVMTGLGVTAKRRKRGSRR